MKLTDLNPEWCGAGGDGVTQNGQPVPRREGVGVIFDCPCGGGERVFIGFKNPFDDEPPYVSGGHHWTRTGDTFDTLTLKPSIQRSDPKGCRWHGFITNGEVRPA